MEGPIHGGAYPWRGLFSEFYGRLFLESWRKDIWWWKKAGGGWLSLKDQNFGDNNVHCCRPRKSVFRVQPPDIYNRPSPSSKNPHSLNDGKCKAFLVIMIFFAWEYKMVFISMASHLASLWNRGLRQLESGQILRIGSHLASLIPNQIFPVEPLIQKWELSQQEDSSRYSVFFVVVFLWFSFCWICFL